MKTYIALLRGINVGGHKKIKMADLRVLMNQLGFSAVETYIQSGNIVFDSNENERSLLGQNIKKAIAETFGFDVPILLKTKQEIAAILEESPFKKAADIAENKIYYTLLHETPKEDAIASLVAKDYPNERFVITANCVYLNCFLGAGKAKLNNALIERKLNVQATTRNHRTLLKLLAMVN